MDRLPLVTLVLLPCLSGVVMQSGTAFSLDSTESGDGQGRWSLISGVSIMPRQQLPFCATSANPLANRGISVKGGGQPAFYLDGQRSSTLTYEFEGAALVLYGGAVSQNGNFSPPTVVVDGNAPNAASYPVFEDGLACDVVLAVFNGLGPTTHSMNIIGAPGQQMVIYNATIFATTLSASSTIPLSTSLPGPSMPSSLGSGSASDAIQSPTSTSAAGKSLSPTSGTSVEPDSASATTASLHKSRSVEPILAIALSLALGLTALAMLVVICVCRRRRRFRLSPYNDQLRTPREEPVLGGAAKKSGFLHEDTATGTAGDDTGDTQSMESEGAKLAAIRRELRSAGLSTEALLHSLRRLRVHHREAGSETGTAGEPPGYTL